MKELNGLQTAELRHRLFSNLQLLQALLAIRLRSVRDPESQRHLQWLTDVVTALALINRRLDDRGLSDFGGYLIESVGFWRRVCAGRDIGFSLEADPVALPERLASSLALIVHELIANSVEHAFTDGRPGRVALSLSARDGWLTLVVADDGRGSELGLDQPEAQGMELVRGLAEHLGGEYRTLTDNGFEVTVRVPLEGDVRRRRKPGH